MAANRLNAKKGGRPKGYAALQAEKQREMIAKKLEKEFEPIVLQAIKDAKTGDKHARDWLTEQAYGKVPDNLNIDDPSDRLKTIIVRMPNAKKATNKKDNS